MSIVSDQQGVEDGSAERFCQFPGCVDPEDPDGRPRRAAERSGDRGRKPDFCGQRVGTQIHNRQNANAEVQRQNARLQETMRRGNVDASTPAEARKSAPVDLARASAGVLLEQMRKTAAEQAETAQQIVAQLTTVADPANLETQLAAATTAARADVATARAAQASAEQLAQAATVQATAAAAVAESANAAAEEAETARAAAADEAVAATEQAARAEDALRAEQTAHEATRDELREQRDATSQQAHRADQAETEAGLIRAELTAERATHAETRSELQTARTELGEVRSAAATAAAVAVERERSLTDQVDRLTIDLDHARTQVEQLHADVRAADTKATQQTSRAERAEADLTRINDAVRAARVEHDEALSELVAMSEKLSQLRIDSATAAAIATTQLETARTETANLREQLNQVDAEARAATARALSAEAKLSAAAQRRRD